MDPWDPLPGKKNDDKAQGWLYNNDGISKDDRDYPDWDLVRQNMGYTLNTAKKIDLNKMIPRSELSTTTYCLADEGEAYLVYLPEGGEAKIDLKNADGEFTAEWFIPLLNKTIVATKKLQDGKTITVESPASLDAVLT